MYDPLPSPDEARCRLARDLLLQVHGMLALRGLGPQKAYQESRNRQRDAILANRLAGVVPRAEMARATSGSGLDLDALSRRVPAAHAMWVMITALVAQQVEADLAQYQQTHQ